MSNAIVLQRLREAVLFVQLCCVFIIGKTLLQLSVARTIIVKLMHKAAGMSLPEDLYWNSLFTQAMMKTLWRQGILDIRKSAAYGKPAPNPSLVDPKSGKEILLLKAINSEKIQILAFGSYTCPVFCCKFEELRSIAQEYQHVADTSVIYIDEAHPSDGWAFKSDVVIKKHQSIADRLNASKQFSSAFAVDSIVRVFADTMKNEATTQYGVEGIRLYIIHNQSVIYEGGTGPTYYSLEEVRQVVMQTSASRAVV